MRTTAPLGPARFKALPVVEVTVLSGPMKGQSVKLKSGGLVIGSDPECDLVLDDAAVSARHCEVSLSPEGVVLRDLGSTNGLRAGTVWLKECVVEPGTRLVLGKTDVRIAGSGKTRVAVLPEGHYGALIGQSVPMRVLFAELEAVAKSDLPLLLEGETGTGKGLCAEAVHHAGPRAAGPLTLFDCGAGGVDAELFGERGLLAQSAGGTLVLDDIAELPASAQPRLLRVLDEASQVRIVACTNRSLRGEVARGKFREDLFYRLSGLRVAVPPLRQHLEDIPSLVDALMERGGATTRWADLPAEIRSMFGHHRWPGNVRELRNAVERLIAMPAGSSLPLLDDPGLPPTAPEGEAAGPLLPLTLARERSSEAFERRYLAELMQRAKGSISEGARLARVSRQFLQRLLRKHAMR